MLFQNPGERARLAKSLELQRAGIKSWNEIGEATRLCYETLNWRSANRTLG
jgi:hypothetical protein